MTRYLLVFSLVALFLYPAYLLVVVAIDSLIGEKLFYSEMLFSYRSDLVAIVAGDWLHALPYALAIGFMMTAACARFPARLLPSLVCGVLLGCLLGFAAGMATEPYVGISLGLAVVITSPLLCLRKRNA